MAALAGVSLCLTVLAAEVSPPNANTMEGEHIAIKLPNATLDRYVGSYKLNEQTFIDVKREGGKLMAKLTGQPWLEMAPERENLFFLTASPQVQFEFANDGTGAATLHQAGHDVPLTRVSAAESQQAQATVDARNASQTGSPGFEDALSRYLESAAAGKVDYATMEPQLAEVARKQDAQFHALFEQYGTVQSIQFVGVGASGLDVYNVKFTNGSLQFRLALGDGGKISAMGGSLAP
jgi:hypothetical protein